MDIPPPPAPAPIQPVPVRHPHHWLIVGATLGALVALILGGAGLYMRYHHPAPSAGNLVQVNPQVAYDKGDLDGSLARLDAILKTYTQPVANFTYLSTLVLKSQALSQKGSLTFQESTYGPQAAAVAQTAIALAATSSEAYRALGFADEVQQKYADAHTAYQQAITLNPKNAAALTGDARVYELQGDAAKAKAGYTAALVANPQAYAADLGLGRLASEAGDTEGALTHFKNVYSYAPNSHDQAQAAYSIGMLLIGQKNANLGRGYMETAVALDPKYPSALFGLGVAFYAQAIGSSTSAVSSAGLMKAAESQLENAVAALPAGSTTLIAHPQFSLDMAVVGKSSPALAALAGVEAAVSSDSSVKPEDKDKLLAHLNAFIALVKQGPPTAASK